MDLNEGDVNFGITQLDNLTIGTLSTGTLGLAYGNPGTGKSSVMAHFLFKGAEMDSNVCMIGNEPPAKVASQISTFNTYRSNWLKDGYISIFSLKDLMNLVGIDPEDPDMNDMDLTLDLILQSLDHLDAKRLVIDPVNPLLNMVEKDRRGFFLQELKDGLQKMGVTAFLCLDTVEKEPTISGHSLDQQPFDVVLRFSKEVEQPTTLNTFTIERWKGHPHAKNMYVIDVSANGIILVPRIKPLEVR